MSHTTEQVLSQIVEHYKSTNQTTFSESAVFPAMDVEAELWKLADLGYLQYLKESNILGGTIVLDVTKFRNV